MSAENLLEMDRMYKAMVADRDAWKAKAERYRNALDQIIDYATDWYGYYCSMWGNRRKEQQDSMLDEILKARAALTGEIEK